MRRIWITFSPGKVSKAEALAHFSVRIEEAAALSADEGRAAKTLALETQIKLLGAMDDKPTSSAGAHPLVNSTICMLGLCKMHLQFWF